MYLIKKYEGLRLQAYRCPAGVWTIGYGTTHYPNGQAVCEGDMITADYAEALLNNYVIHEIHPVFTRLPYELSPHQKEALASLIYNWGAQGFLKSKLYQALCRKDWESVCREWDYGYKNGLLGILKRRTEELALFMRDVG